MPVISFHFDRINIEKKKPLEVPLKVENGMKIVDIKEEDVPISGGKKEKVLRFYYEYSVEYKPNQADILIGGNLIFFEPEEKLDGIKKEWDANKKLPGNLMQEVMNNVLIRCQVKALALSQDIGLPPHIRLPTVSSSPTKEAAVPSKGKAEDYIG
tara:strand:- start:549 stop:1013 length:465 start_codon:yes stop_codon:yes gene_type:complete